MELRMNRDLAARKVAPIAFAVLLLAGCGGDSAARKQEADAIAKGILGYLATLEDPNAPVGLHHDAVTVTPDNDGKSFDVAITGLRYADAKGQGATLGELDYRLTPGDQNTYQVSDLKAPTELPIVTGGKTVASLKFQTTVFSGVWSTPLQNFLKLDWQAKDISFSVADKPDLVAKASAMALTTDGKDTGKGRIDQSTDFVFSGITAVDPADGMNLAIAKADSKVAFTNFDTIAYRQQIGRLRDIMAKFAPKIAQDAGGNAAQPATPPAITDEDRKVLVDVVSALPKTISSYSWSFGVDGVSASAVDGSLPVQLAHGGLDFALKGIDADKAEMDLSVRHDGLALSGPEVSDPIVQALYPRVGNLSLAATDIPVSQLVDSVVKALPQLTSGDAAAAQGGQMMLMGGLMQALSQSTIKLRIDPSELDGAITKLTAAGDLKLAMTSPTMAAGTVNFTLTGLDDLMSLLTTQPASNPMALGMMSDLQKLRDFAQRETGADGKPVDKFKVDATETGQLLINGKPADGF